MKRDIVELKSCPFCGSLAHLHCYGHIFEGDPGFRVECAGRCHAMTCCWHTKDQATANWNTREAASELQRLRGEVEMLRGAVGKPVAWVLPSELAELADPRSLRQSLHIWGHQPWTGFVPLYALNLQGE